MTVEHRILADTFPGVGCDIRHEVLKRDDLTLEQRREIAETLSTRAVEFDVSAEATVDKNP